MAAQRTLDPPTVGSIPPAPAKSEDGVKTAEELTQELDALKAEYQRAFQATDEDEWLFDIPPADKTCVEEYRIRWLHVRDIARRLERAIKDMRELLICDSGAFRRPDGFRFTGALRFTGDEPSVECHCDGCDAWRLANEALAEPSLGPAPG